MKRDSCCEKKKLRFKRFLRMLSNDPSLLSREDEGEARSLAEYFAYSGYFPRNEPVDLSLLVSLLLKRSGHGADSEKMMEFVMNGGTIDAFMDAARAE
ncbi:hypothetical protein ACFPPD_10950 [Cohnella suwonensis]|uniref:Uncharacterized protein n=1 Tax=Cohnella suwonensis TaxID=696072 RepID=A0ABW0LXA2_9BACL